MGLINVMSSLTTFTNGASVNASTTAGWQDIPGMVTSSYSLSRPGKILVLMQTSVKPTNALGVSAICNTQMVTNGVASLVSGASVVQDTIMPIMSYHFLSLAAGTYSTKMQSQFSGASGNPVYFQTGIQVFLLGG